MLLGASPRPEKQVHPVEHSHASTRRAGLMADGDVTGSREKPTIASDTLRSMHYYRNWANGLLLSQDKGHIDSLAQAFSEGKFVVTLTQIALGEKVPGTKNDPAYLKHRLGNTQKCIEILSNRGIVLEGVVPEDIVNGKKIPIKIFCQALEREHKNIISTEARKTSTGNLPTSQPHHKIVSSPSITKSVVKQIDKDIVLEDINVVTSQQTQQVDNVNANIANETQNNKSENTMVKRSSIEIPTHKQSNKFLPSPPKPVVSPPTHDEDFKSNDDAKILRIHAKADSTNAQHLQKSQLKQRRYSPLDITKLAGKLFDAFSTFSNNDLPELAEEPNEESLLHTNETMDSPGDSHQADTTTLALDVINKDDSPVKDNLTVLPSQPLIDISPSTEDDSTKKDAKRILRKSKRQATSIDSLDIISARDDDVTEIHLSNTELLIPQDSLSSDRDSTDALEIATTPDSIDSNKTPRRKEKNISKENHRLKSTNRSETHLTEAHSVEDVWLELQRMKTTVRTHHAIASKFAQDYPVMRRCFESQNQSVRKLERIQHTRSRNTEKELQGKLAIMEGYLVQTMRENADLRGKVWGLTTRLTQLEKAGVSSRPNSILSLSEVQRREQPGIQDISKIKRSLKLKKFFGEEPPPLLEEIPTSFSHDASREDDEVV